MAWLGTAGDTSDVSEEDMNQKRSGKPIEAGWYRVALEKDDVKHEEWGVGLKMEFEILDGEYEGRKLFEFLCLEHSRSAEAQKIARTKLRELAVAAGHKTPDNVEDTDVLMRRPVMVEVYRAKLGKNEDPKYADPDGRKARIGQFISVARWKAENGQAESKPDFVLTRPKSKPAPKPNMRAEIPADDDIPF